MIVQAYKCDHCGKLYDSEEFYQKCVAKCQKKAIVAEEQRRRQSERDKLLDKVRNSASFEELEENLREVVKRYSKTKLPTDSLSLSNPKVVDKEPSYNKQKVCCVCMELKTSYLHDINAIITSNVPDVFTERWSNPLMYFPLDKFSGLNAIIQKNKEEVDEAVKEKRELATKRTDLIVSDQVNRLYTAAIDDCIMRCNKIKAEHDSLLRERDLHRTKICSDIDNQLAEATEKIKRVNKYGILR